MWLVGVESLRKITVSGAGTTLSVAPAPLVAIHRISNGRLPTRRRATPITDGGRTDPYLGLNAPHRRWVWLFWWDGGGRGGALVVGVTVVASEVVRWWLKVAFTK